MDGKIFRYVKDFSQYNTTLNEETDYSTGVNAEFCKGYIETNLDKYTDEGGSFKKCCTNALSHITDLTSKPEKNITGFCEYTNYWLYGKLKSINKITNYKKLLHNLFHLLDNFEDCEKHTEAIDDSTYGYLKELDNLYENFYIFTKEPPSQDQEPCEKGRKCVQDYKSHEITCKSNGNNSFCNELENFRVLFNKQLKSKNECHDIEELPSFQGPSLAATISLPVTVMSVVSFFSFITYKANPFLQTTDQIHETLFTIRQDFSNYKKDDYSNIFSTNDPVLRNTALYIGDIYNYFNNICSVYEETTAPCKEACKHMNNWINVNKSIYTCNGTCNLYKDIWDKHIEELWKTLERKSKNANWCTRQDNVYDIAFPNGKIPPICNKKFTPELSITWEGPRVAGAEGCHSTCPRAPEPQDAETPLPESAPHRVFQLTGYVLFGISVIFFMFYKVKRKII